jgi:hypothetical protein
MPTIAQIGPYRIYFYSHDMQEPRHVHVDREDNTAKFWLTPVALAANIGFRAKELRYLQRLVAERAAQFLEAWDDYFGS